MSTNSPNTSAESVMTVPKFRDRAGTSTPLVCLTAYTTPMARILDRHCDLLLVGDSVGTVLHGLPNTLGVTLEHMILHGQAVVRGARNALVIVDMPYGSYEESPQVAFRNASRLVKETGCAGVKLEWHEGIEATVSYLVYSHKALIQREAIKPFETLILLRQLSTVLCHFNALVLSQWLSRG
jgi:3-methyl-2-oxobutanoate hydroxymethyltransferase